MSPTCVCLQITKLICSPLPPLRSTSLLSRNPHLTVHHSVFSSDLPYGQHLSPMIFQFNQTFKKKILLRKMDPETFLLDWNSCELWFHSVSYFPLLASSRVNRGSSEAGGRMERDEDEYQDVAPQTNMRVLTAARRFDVPSIKRG